MAISTPNNQFNPKLKPTTNIFQSYGPAIYKVVADSTNQTKRRTNGQTDRQKDGPTDRQTDKKTDQRTDRLTKRRRKNPAVRM